MTARLECCPWRRPGVRGSEVGVRRVRAQLREDLAAPRLPFVIGEMGHWCALGADSMRADGAVRGWAVVRGAHPAAEGAQHTQTALYLSF